MLNNVKYVQNNAYFAHPEAVLLSLVCDESPVRRIIGIQHILRIRANSHSRQVRKFEKPKVNFSAESIVWLSDLLTATTEPPLTEHLSNENIKDLISAKFEVEYECHSQSVERAVQLTTKAVVATSDQNSQDAMTINTISARKKQPNLRSVNFSEV